MSQSPFRVVTSAEGDRKAESDLCALLIAKEIRSDLSRMRLVQEYEQKLANQRCDEIVLRQHYHYATYHFDDQKEIRHGYRSKPISA